MLIRAELKDRNEDNMEDTIKIRKDKIKNVAIVFLSVMLALTFFSNSILNRALPEVATAYVQYNTITEKVRGNGMVTADDPYKVVVKDTRTIESVAVKVGDEVMKDQVLFYLEDAESEELKAKEKEVEAKEDEIDAKLEQLNQETLSYMTAVLSVDISNPAFQNIQNDNIASVTAYQAQIEASRQKVDSAQKTVDSLKRQLLIAGMEPESSIDNEKDLAAAEAALESAKKQLNTAQEQVNSAQGTISIIDQYAGAVDADGDGFADDTEAKLETIKSEKSADYNTKWAEYEAARDALKDELSGSTDSAEGVSIDEFFNDEGLPKDEGALDIIKTVAAGKNKIGGFLAGYDALLGAMAAKSEAESYQAAYPQEKVKLDVARTALASAQGEYDTWSKKVSSLKNETKEDAEDQLEYKNNLNLSLSDAETALEKAKEEQAQLLKDIASELALSSQNDSIDKIEKELAELNEELAEVKGEYEEIQASLVDATVTAPVEGTIISIDKIAGESTVPQEAIATIQVAGKGMSLSFSVTNAQAAKVKVGDKAQLQNAWYYNDVMITLSKIKPDPEDPGKKKLLEFTVEGMVQNGESLAISVGERSAEYEHVVPNSAVREDNKGKFILIIDEKTTPFGNRYKARRVDVEVLASDEINTAVSADLQGYEYVITTSNQPVKAGDQVRLNG